MSFQLCRTAIIPHGDKLHFGDHNEVDITKYYFNISVNVYYYYKYHH